MDFVLLLYGLPFICNAGFGAFHGDSHIESEIFVDLGSEASSLLKNLRIVKNEMALKPITHFCFE